MATSPGQTRIGIVSFSLMLHGTLLVDPEPTTGLTAHSFASNFSDRDTVGNRVTVPEDKQSSQCFQ